MYVPIINEADLRKFYEELMASPTTPSTLSRSSAELVINRVNNTDDIWPEAIRCNIRYCVSRATTGAYYQQVVNAMIAASSAWSNHIGIRMVHAADQDNNCTPQNMQVDFDVQVTNPPDSGAIAFFPSFPRARRNLHIYARSFITSPPPTLEGLLRHEIGHILGFRHEHTRPEAGQCFEDNNWRPLTPYDSASVMHYPQCGGTVGQNLNITNNDIAGATLLYGNQANCRPVQPPPQAIADGEVAVTTTGSIDFDSSFHYPSYLPRIGNRPRIDDGKIEIFTTGKSATFYPINGATVAYSRTKQDTFEACTNTPIQEFHAPANLALTPNTIVCVRTQENNISAIRISNIKDNSIDIFYKTWQLP